MTDHPPEVSAPFEQIGLCVPDPQRAMKLLETLGAHEWTRDEVSAMGTVKRNWAANRATLLFNYQLFRGLEFEYLNYTEGNSWHDNIGSNNFFSHIARHVDDLEPWKQWADENCLFYAQHVKTADHTNPTIKDSRRYEYLIIDTRAVLGFDIKLIKRWYLSDKQ